MKFTFNEYFGWFILILVDIGLLAMVFLGKLSAEIVSGALIMQAGTVITFFFGRKPKPPIGGATP